MTNLVEKTRLSLIAQHGESNTYISNGRTYKHINVYLDAFNVFVRRFESLIDKLQFDCSAYEGELATMFEYFEQADEASIESISKSIIGLNRRISEETLAEYQARMQQFFESIKTIKQSPKFNIEQIKVCFVQDLGMNVRIGTNMHKIRAGKRGWCK